MFTVKLSKEEVEEILNIVDSVAENWAEIANNYKEDSRPYVSARKQTALLYGLIEKLEAVFDKEETEPLIEKITDDMLLSKKKKEKEVVEILHDWDKSLQEETT